MTSRCWCFTLNNYNDEDLENIMSAEVQYLIFGKEVGKEGTPHLQGYVRLNKSVRMTGLKKLFNCNSIHVEKRYASEKQAIEYCKKDGDFIEKGELKGQGFRTDIQEITDLIYEGSSVADCVDENPSAWVKYHKGFKAVMYDRLRPINKEVKVFYLWGDAGVGKTRWVYDNYDDIYSWDGS